jgi:hypothetical protein
MKLVSHVLNCIISFILYFNSSLRGIFVDFLNLKVLD